MSNPSFADLGVPAPLAATLASRGIDKPFPIQAATLPDGLAGHDICGRAPTGSGKTIAYGLPLAARVGGSRPGRPRGLVLVPTRELASQVRDELIALSSGRRPSVAAIHGGVGFDRQINALRRGVDIIVACPGRLADLLERKQLRLDEVEMVVIDEADRLADMGFLPEVRRLLDRCPSDRQTLLFSATLDGDVDVLVKRYQNQPKRHELAPAEDAGNVEHHFWKVDRQHRVRTAAAVIDRAGQTVVFCRTKHGADRVARQLESAGVTAAAIHGGRSQGQRDRALGSFHRGDVAALVATDVAARGIHVDDVAVVIHFDPPADHKDYTHRSGRTARAGRDGVVVTLVPDEVRGPVSQLQRKLGMPVRLDDIAVEALTAAPARQRPARRVGPRDEAPRRPAQQHSKPKHRASSNGNGSTKNANPNAPRRPSGAARRKAKRQGRPARA